MRDLAIRNTHPTVATIRGEIDAWDSDGNIVELDEDKIKVEFDNLVADFNSKKYQRDRINEYPDLQECIHAILDGELTALQKKRSAVKDKFPKPE